METKENSNAKRTAIKVGLVAVISLLLLIPLAMVKGVIEDRKQTKDTVTKEVQTLMPNLKQFQRHIWCRMYLKRKW